MQYIDMRRHFTSFLAFIVPLVGAMQLVRADQVSCSVIPLNADTFGNIGVLVPAGGKANTYRVRVRMSDVIGDTYTDCTNVGLCPMPHGDVANVTYYTFPDELGTVYAFTFYNAKGAHVKYIEECVSFGAPGAAESPENRFKGDLKKLKPYAIVDDFLKSKR